MTQIVGDRVNKFVAENSIDTFLVYSFPCSGSAIPFDSCQWDEPHYLIWKQSGSFHLKRFDYCKTFKNVSLDTINPLTFYLNNKKAIDIEEIKEPTYYEVKKRGKNIDTLITTSGIGHSCYHTFQLLFSKKSKYADVYDLGFKTFDDGRKNIYYDYNQGTKFKTLIDLTISLIRELENGNKFIDE